jgi:imidazolonepropionase-like amidohydrolase
VAHVTGSDDLAAALDAGVHWFAHIPFRDVVDADLAGRLAAEGAVVTTTLSFVDSLWRLSHGTLEELSDPALLDDVHQEVVDALQTADFQAWISDPVRQARLDDAHDNLALSFGALVSAGVRLVVGTDAGNPGVFHGLAVRRELALMVEYGLTPAEAIQAATAASADLLGRTDAGRLAPDAVADLLIVAGDPTVDIAALADVTAVWQGGEEIDRNALRIFH